MLPRSNTLPGSALSAFFRFFALFRFSAFFRFFALFVPAALLLGSGCVRLSEPDVFTCNVDSDCDPGEKCSNQHECQSDSICSSDYDCRDSKICIDALCSPPLCTQTFGQCGLFMCANGRCSTYCSGNLECNTGSACAFSRCVALGQLPNTTSCKTNTDCKSKNCCPRDGYSFCQDTCPKPNGASCNNASECASEHCCVDTGAQTTTCTDLPCSSIPECNTNTDCTSGEVCVAQYCQPPPVVVPGKNGSSCSTPEQCQSGSCKAGTCRGPAGSTCTADTQCDAVCCERGQPGTSGRQCSTAKGGCPGTIGAKCTANSDCLLNRCNSTWCTKACSSNAECEVSPWGSYNACETNGAGDKICFPGCTTSDECQSNLDSSVLCYPALDSSVMVCAKG
ncbi:MAG: hypothetical protein ABW061_27920 [Polyangiaceae bacterium]